MKSLRLLSLTMLFSLGIGIPSCTLCDCPPLTGNYFKVEQPVLRNYRLLPSGPVEQLEELDSVTLNTYRIELAFEYNYYGSLQPAAHTAPFSLMNSAYACTCQENGKLGSKEKIQTLNLLSIHDFNEQYRAGDRINELFEISTYQDTLSVDEFIKRELRQEPYYLHLKEKPTTGEAFQLKLVLVLDNGDKLETTNEAVIIE